MSISTLTFDPALTSMLIGVVDQQQWSTIVSTALGTNRRLRGKRDPAANAPDVWATGVEFLNAASTGPLSISGGNITDFGNIGSTTVSQNATLNTGKSVLRLEGNGHWAQGTFGLTGSGCDWTMRRNYIGTSGITTSNIGIKAPTPLPTGTGPHAPSLDVNAPYSIDIMDAANRDNPVLAGTFYLDKRVENFVYDDAEAAANLGDIRVTQSNGSVVFGAHEFGATMWSMNPIVNSIPGEVLHQVLIGVTPLVSNWPNYPTSAGYIDATTDTFMKPFKAIIRNAAGVALYTHEMYDGLPINDSSLAQELDGSLKPVRFHMHCGMMLPWQSRKPKLNSKAAKYFAGMEPDVLRGSIMRFKVGFNMAHPVFGGSGNVNSLGHWFAAPKRPVAPTMAAVLAESNSSQDPNLWTVYTEYAPYGTAVNSGIAYAIPWGYEPGSLSLHDHYTGPGGVRSDRAIMPITLATFFTDQTYVRPYHNDSIVDMTDHWNMAYFNHPHHYLTNPKTFDTISVEEVLNGVWSYGRGTYYGGNDTYVSGGRAKTIPMFGLGASAGYNSIYRDKNGKKPWNGSAIDFLHNYSTPAWTALMFNSPMHAYSAKLRLLASIMAQLSQSGTRGFWTGVFMTRQHSWRLLHLALGWKLSSSHALGISRALLEKRLVEEFEAINDEIVVPAKSANPPQFHRTFNNLGCYSQIGYPYENESAIASTSGSASTTIPLAFIPQEKRDDSGNLMKDGNGNQLYNYLPCVENHNTFPVYGKDTAVSPSNPRTIIIYPANPTSADIQNAPRFDVIGFDATANTITTSTPVPANLLVAGMKVRNATTAVRVIASAGQMFYMGHCLQLVRQLGLFSVLRQKSAKCEAALLYMIRCLDKFSIDFILDTDGLPEYYWPISNTVVLSNTATEDASVSCASWAEHAATYSKKQGQEDWITNVDGSPRAEVDINQHNRAQWAFIRRDYFGDIPCERANGITLGCAKYRGYYNTFDARYQAAISIPNVSGFDKRKADWGYRMSPLGIIKPTNELGPY